MRPVPALLMSMSSDPKSVDTVVRQDLIDASDRTSSVRNVMLLFHTGGTSWLGCGL
jgi:hypothetical protein